MITTADRIAASQWARNLLANPESFVIFDTETTALLQDNPEIVQIGLLRGDGTAILDCLVSPLAGTMIPAKATEIHGITDAMVQGRLSLEMLLPVLAAAMHGKTVVVYNAAYDYNVLLGCLLRRDWEEKAADAWMMSARWYCAMKKYSQFVGEQGRYGEYRWQKLPGGDHSAIGDCKACFELIREMAAEATP